MTTLHERLLQLDRRDWWLWWTATGIMVGLLAVIGILTVASALNLIDALSLVDLETDVRGLTALVALFILYALHQQLFIKRLRLKLLNQIEAMVELHDYAERQRLEATLDPLTGLPNRRLLYDRLRSETARARRHGYPLAVVAFDLDGFKPINDTYGHAAGDLVLQCFADQLRKVIRGSDVAARTGGDEFLLLLPECRPAQIERVLGRMKSLHIEFEGQQIPFAYSMGCTGYQPEEKISELLERADRELYRDKRTRRAQRAS